MSILETCKKARVASVELAKLSGDAKDKALCRMANALETNSDRILAANKEDAETAKAHGMKSAQLDRLALDKRKIENMARCIREVSELPDPVGAPA